MSTKEKEKKKIKKEKAIDSLDDIFVICMILFANIFYTLPLAIAGSHAFPLTYLIYIVFPVLIAVISTIYGYTVGKDFKLSIIMYILIMPALILSSSSNILDNVSFYFILAFCYFTLSIAAVSFGDYAKELEGRNKAKKNVKAKAKVMARKEKV